MCVARDCARDCSLLPLGVTAPSGRNSASLFAPASFSSGESGMDLSAMVLSVLLCYADARTTAGEPLGYVQIVREELKIVLPL